MAVYIFKCLLREKKKKSIKKKTTSNYCYYC